MQTPSRELFVKDSQNRFMRLVIRSANPFFNDTTINLKFFTSGTYEAGGITFKFSSSDVPTFKVVGCSSEKRWDTFPGYGTAPFLWTITYKKFNKKLSVTLNGRLVLDVQRSAEFCDKIDLSHSDTVWNREKTRLKFYPDDTASLNYKVCHFFPCKWSGWGRFEVKITNVEFYQNFNSYHEF